MRECMLTLHALVYIFRIDLTGEGTKSSLFQMRITASVSKSSHQDFGLWYLHLPILLHALSSSTVKEKVVVVAVFRSKLDHRPLFNYTYYETVLA